MQIVLNTTEMVQIDRTTIDEVRIPGVVLMENAGCGVVEEIERFLGDVIDKQVVIFSGKGNNGGDGYVIARHLYNRGAKVVVFAGSVGITGAATLTAISSLQVGAGLTKLGVPASLNPILEQKLTEVMTVPLAETNQQSISLKAKDQISELLDWADVLAVRPGLSTNPDTVEFVKWILSSANKPMVLDADGLNALTSSPELIKNYPADLIITPHPGELARLIKLSIADIQQDRLNVIQKFAREWGKVIVLKGGPTVIAAPNGDLFINSTGNPGLATGGSGDVLTGMIAGLLAQKLSAIDAALVGVYLHGLAGDLAAVDLSEMGMIAEDICDYLPVAIKEVMVI